MRRRATVLAGIAILSGAVTLGSVALHRIVAAPVGSGIPVYGRVPQFRLIGHKGGPITSEMLRGSVWIADFIFTRCAGQCPVMTRQMADLQRDFLDVPSVLFVSFSVDPSHDTPEVLTAYAERFDAQASWRFVTGPVQEIEDLVREGFRLGLGQDGTAEEPITHSVRLALVDPSGRIRGYYDATEPEAMSRLKRDVRRLLEETRE
jgi:protein SCO1/2